MKLIDILKKLGIIRGGVVGGTYKSYKDMPDELMYDNVYDKKTDLVDGGDMKKIKDVIAGGNTTGKKSSSLLFYILFFVSVIITLLFVFSVGKFNFGLILLFLILIFFIFRLFKYKNDFVSLKYIWILFFVYVIVSFIILMIVTPVKNQSILSNKKIDNISKTEPSKPLEWIDYIGDKSASFTFKYPNIYNLQDNGTSALVFVDKTKDYDYHTTFTMLEGTIPVSKDCEGLARAVIAGKSGSEFRYAKQSTMAGVIGCEYGINLVQDGKKIYEISYNFAAKNKTFYLTSYATKLADLDILNQIMQSFKIK